MSKRATKAPQYEEVSYPEPLKKPPGRFQLWIRDFGQTVGWYLVPLVILAVFAGPTRTARVPFTTTPRPLWLLALELSAVMAAAAHINGWRLTRKATR